MPVPLEQKLLTLKKAIEASRLRKAELEGQKKEYLKRLVEECGSDSLDVAVEKIKELGKQASERKERLEKKVKELEKKYGHRKGEWT